jgi:hypothetical protein
VPAGLAESTFYPGMQYIIGSWYRKDELAKRSCIFHTSSGIASMFSGYLMAGVYNLGGRGGFKGWQWYFSASHDFLVLTPGEHALTMRTGYSSLTGLYPSQLLYWALSFYRMCRKSLIRGI